MAPTEFNAAEQEEFDTVRRLMNLYPNASELVNRLNKVGFRGWEFSSDDSMAASQGEHGTVAIKQDGDRVVEILYESHGGKHAVIRWNEFPEKRWFPPRRWSS